MPSTEDVSNTTERQASLVGRQSKKGGKRGTLGELGPKFFFLMFSMFLVFFPRGFFFKVIFLARFLFFFSVVFLGLFNVFTGIS